MSIFSLNAWSVTLLLLLTPSFSAWFLLSRFRCESPFPAQQLQNTYSLYAPTIPNLFDAKVFMEQTKNKAKKKPGNTLLTSDSNITTFWPPEKSSLTKPGQKSKAPRPAPKEWSANHEGSGTNSASNLPAKERQIVTGHYGRSCATGEGERERGNHARFEPTKNQKQEKKQSCTLQTETNRKEAAPVTRSENYPPIPWT